MSEKDALKTLRLNQSTVVVGQKNKQKEARTQSG